MTFTTSNYNRRSSSPPTKPPYTFKPQSYSKSEGNPSFVDSSSLLNTPKMIFVLANPSEKDGYDSDSSDEGRKPATPQTLKLRVLNPDEDTSNTPTPTTPHLERKIEEKRVLVTPSPPNESEWKASKQQKPDLPLHQPVVDENNIIRRESKTLDAAYADNVTTNQLMGRNSPNEPVPPLSNDTISEFAPPTSPSFSHSSSKKPPPPTNFANPITSKYAKVSYHLTNDPTAIKKYRTMAEKTNDPTTQLMFAKYLLETANAFLPTTDQQKVVVGSMWGIGSTTNKTQKPEPFLVVPAPDHLSMSSSASSSGTKTKSMDEVCSSKSYQSTTYQQQSLMNVTLKQQASLNKQHRKTSNTTHNSNYQKRKLLEQEGIKWITKLAKRNVPEACYMQAHWMENQLYDFKPNKTKSFALHLIAAKSGIPESLYAVAKHYEEEGGKDVSVSKIAKLYKSAADAGYVNAIYKLAFLTIHGKLEIRQSLTEGLNLMYKACTLSSESFNTPPHTFALILTNEYEQVDFPLSLLEPFGGKEAAILYHERAARLGNDEAQAKLGSIYEHGLYGESMNFARAFDFYEQAAYHGNDKAMLGLCRLNNQGSHGPGDKNESTRLENDVSGWLAATPINEDLAFFWCEKAAKTGNVDALSLLGWFYESGFGAPRDFSMAKKYYELAVEKGDLGAKSRLVSTNVSITKKQHESINGGVNNHHSSPPTKARKRTRSLTDSKKHNNCKCM